MTIEVLAIGTMTGTSMDGINVALLRLMVDKQTDAVLSFSKVHDCEIKYQPEFHLLLKAMEYVLHQVQGNEQIASEQFNLQRIQQFLQSQMAMTKDECSVNMRKMKQYLKIYCSDVKQSLYQQLVKHSTDLHAALIKTLLQETKVKAEQIHYIGYHGQTLYHQPKLLNGQPGCTIQIGDGERLALMTGCTVINHFRDNDVAHGGQGAPFAPLYHLALVQRDQRALP